MTKERREDLTVVLGGVLVIVSLVAFAAAMLSPLVAAFIGGLGAGGGGVIAIQRARPPR